MGQYEIVAPLGAGGMGEVYRARDTRLGREVALKVLPAAMANDAERMARFQREAQVLATLNHPNIAAIYGFEESRGMRALVMELVEGPTLTERIAQGPIPLDEALPTAKQIAEGLEAAHERRIVHRDLKPANIKITPDGKVKVLDFGLAKAFEAEDSSTSIANSPTLTVAATQAGVILGTAAYMSPEQARGKKVDRRADIWAFGCVLYEMLAGRQAFGGETLSDVLAAVIMKDLDWAALPARMPTNIRNLLRRCLAKDPRQRLQAIGEARIEIGEAIAAPTGSSAATALSDLAPQAANTRPFWRQPLMAALVLFLIATSATALFLWTRSSSPPGAVSRLVIPLAPNQELTDSPAISPDGEIVAYTAREGVGVPQLYLRDLNSFEARTVVGSYGGMQPFFSPDGRWVAFFAQGQLKKVSVAGGSPTTLASAASPVGGTWNEDGTIIFTSGFGSGLLSIPAAGGNPESLTKPDGASAGYAHLWPQSLPGGRSVLFTILGKDDSGDAVLSLNTRGWQLVLPGRGGAVFGSSGHLFVSDETAGVKAARFDPAHPARTTAETSVLAEVYSSHDERTWLAVSKTGTAVYAPGSSAKRSLVWADRDGNVEPVSKEQAEYKELSLAPDGSKAVVQQASDLWINDFQHGTRRRLTFHEEAGGSTSALWSRDGTRIIFSSNAGGDYDIYSQPPDGSRPAVEILKRGDDQFPTSIAPDGTLVFSEAHPKTGEDLWTLSPDGKVSPLRVTAFNEANAQFSPDGRWVAYESDESGRSEVYVQAYPSGEKRIAVSTGGGILPIWSRDGKELLYCAGDAVVAAKVRADGSFAAGHRKLFDRSDFFFRFHSYDILPDGRRFLMIHRDPGSVPRQLNVILNWFDEVQRLLPAKSN